MIEVYFDGSTVKSNPSTVAGYGFIIKKNGETIAKGHGSLTGSTFTNNEAEYHALIESLKWLSFYVPAKSERIIVRGDSKLVVNQMNTKWKVNTERLKPLYEEAKKLTKELKVEFKWIGREHNTEADVLSDMLKENKVWF